MFPETKSRETLRFEGKQNYFPREQTLSALLCNNEQKSKYNKHADNNIHATIVFRDKNSIE
jgi:hypothetical protein